ncbi:MAG TPA: efflux RND transporter periplasmic adaptor subunit [Candidatus Acidoferrales bacterium]|nr:efflux RND transporter periplasmic adaptor subunit [Candidatus Acidoferrales bacterium]
MRKFLKSNLLPPFFLILAGMAGCTEHAAPPPDVPVVPVMVAQSMEKTMPVELHAIGTGQAYSTVSIESQVAGIVSAVHYTQGQYVMKGDLLVSLDDRPFQAALQLAQANLAKDKANAELASVEAERYQKLFDSGVVPKEQLDQQLATEAADKAAVQADEAAVQAAKLNVSYCSIYAPISGRTGAQLVYPGTVVKADDVPILVVINEISPLYINFAVPQQYLEEIKNYMAKGKLPVQATPSDSSAPEGGYLTFVNNTVDPTTGTVQLIGTFANSHFRLWPGEFVNVVLRLSEQENAIVVPSQAVMTGQDGDYLFVVKPDMTVDLRTVKVTRTVDGLTVIAEGMKAGETVVTDGQVRLIQGSKVKIRTSL